LAYFTGVFLPKFVEGCANFLPLISVFYSVFSCWIRMKAFVLQEGLI
jgi:hypothetical protein